MISTSTGANSLSTNAAKLPIHFENDREAIAQALNSLALANLADAKVMRIADTLSLERLQISEAFTDRAHLEVLAPAVEMRFDSAGNLI